MSALAPLCLPWENKCVFECPSEARGFCDWDANLAGVPRWGPGVETQAGWLEMPCSFLPSLRPSLSPSGCRKSPGLSRMGLNRGFNEHSGLTERPFSCLLTAQQQANTPLFQPSRPPCCYCSLPWGCSGLSQGHPGLSLDRTEVSKMLRQRSQCSGIKKSTCSWFFCSKWRCIWLNDLTASFAD